MQRPSAMRRLGIAGSLALGVMLLAGRTSVAACQWIAPSIEEAATTAELIYVGEVLEVPKPYTYAIAVTRTFRGEPPASLRYSLSPGEGASSCHASLEAGTTYLFATDKVAGSLGIGDVWFELEGDHVLPYYLGWDGSAAELFTLLGELPNTSLAADPGKSDARLAGILFVILAFAKSTRAWRRVR